MPLNETQTTNRQHAVPQNIMDVEFKIIGELTMRQFIYLILFGGFGYMAAVSINNLLRWPIVLFSVASGLAFAFVPLEERGLDEWVINFFKAVYSNNQKVWRKNPEVLDAFDFENLDVVRHELITLTPTSSRRKLEEFLDQQNQRVKKDPLDIPESEYIKKVSKAFEGYVPPQPVVTQTTIATTPEPQGELLQENGDNNVAPTTTQDQTNSQTQATTQEEQKPHIKAPEPIKKKKSIFKLPSRSSSGDYNQGGVPLGSDTHSGRRFTNLLPKQGEIILPIRGERVLNSDVENKIEAEIDTKTQQLEQLLQQIRSGETKTVPQVAVVQTPPAQSSQQPALQNANKDSGNEDNARVKDNNQTTNNVKPQERQAMTSTPQIVPQSSQSMPPTKPTDTHKVQDPDVPQGMVKTPVPMKTAEMQPISTDPNVISGIVKDPNGKAIPGVVLIIKNEREEPVRALKSNNLGQFVISTALTNGHYTVETDKSNKTQFSFDIISFEAKGDTIPPLEIQGKL